MATANFTGSNGTVIRTLTDWDGARADSVAGGACRIQGNEAQADSGLQSAADWWTSDSFNADQKATATITAIASGAYIGVAVRCSGTDNTGNVSAYMFYSDAADGCYIDKYVSGAYVASIAGPGSVFQVGDTIELSVTGTALTAKVNGTTRLSATDSALTSGAPGICSYNAAGSRLDDWTGESLSTGITGALTATLAAATASSAGAVAIKGTSTPTLAAATLSSAAALANTGALTATLAAATLSSAGTLLASGSGSLTATLAAATVSATGAVAITGTLTATLAAATVSATGSAGNTGAVSATLAAATVTAKGYHLEGVTQAGVLRQNASNSRYVENDSGIQILAGIHNWYTVQDGGVGYPPPTFDWSTWDAFATTRGLSFERLWAHETGEDWPDEDGTTYTPTIWPRTGPGTANDGRPKFDLSRINHEYLERLEERVIQAGNSGRFVSVMLFQGWQADDKGMTTGTPARNHPFANGNNINSITVDATDEDVLETRNTANTSYYNLQKAYVDAVLARLNRFHHVVYEISNEETATTTVTAWQQALIDYIHTQEDSMTNQHLVVMSWQWPNGSNATDLYTSNAEIVATGGTSNAPLSDPTAWPDTGASGKVGGIDTDHYGGLEPVAGFHWRAFCRGYGMILLMDSYDGTFGEDWRANAAIEEMRYNLGYIADYAARIDLANATPQGSLASTGYCLAKTTGRQQLIAYQPTSGNFTIDLTGMAGTFSVEFLRCNTGATSTGTTVAGGAVRTLTAPWAGEDFVAFLELSAIGGTLTATLAAATVSSTGTLGATASGALTATLADATISAAGAVAIVATSTTTLAAATVTSTATLANTGALAATLGTATLAATGATGAFALGTLTATLVDATASSTGTLTLRGATTATLDAAALSSTAALANTGAMAATLASATVVAVGVEVVIVSIVAGSIRGAGASGIVHGAGTSGSVRA